MRVMCKQSECKVKWKCRDTRSESKVIEKWKKIEYKVKWKWCDKVSKMIGILRQSEYKVKWHKKWK